MKMRQAHVVTLNEGAIAVLKQVAALGSPDDSLAFPGAEGRPLSDMTLSKIVRQVGQPYTVHGFRSSFRDWVAEQMPNTPDSVAEVALAHSIPDKVMAAYKRTDFINMRRALLNEWSRYISPVTASA